MGRATLRFVASVLATSGVLLLADVAVTLAWQEPVTALLASRAQAALERQLAAVEGGGRHVTPRGCRPASGGVPRQGRDRGERSAASSCPRSSATT